MNVLKALLGTKKSKPIITGDFNGDTVRASRKYMDKYYDAFSAISELQNLTEMPGAEFNPERMIRCRGVNIDKNNDESPCIQLTFIKGEVEPVHACLVDIDGKEIGND